MAEITSRPASRLVEPVSLEEIEAARVRIAPHVVRTPLVRLDIDAPAEIWLKLEILQPIGSFKLRGASNAIGLASPAELQRGVWTASAGNMAQGVAWQARRLGVRCTVVAPDHAPEAKLSAIRRLGATIVQVPFAEWFRVLEERRFRDLEGLFVHPVSDRAVIAGNGTIGLEIAEDLPGVDAVVVPFGGGGLSSGIACALRAVRPATRVYAAEVDTAPALSAALAAGAPAPIEYRASFVDGIGSPSVLPDMWSLVSQVLAGALVVPLTEVAAAIRTLATRAHVVAEGAGAAALAAALRGGAGTGKVACIVSGGNIDPAKLARILAGEMP
jgi:threonine dehydratase